MVVLPDATAGNPQPIGVFDSGVGGLTVVAALRRALPNESFLYLGDTARLPYGTRSASVVRRYATHASKFLLGRGAKMIVVACNTASAHALETLQATLPVPVVGVVEASAMAAAQRIEHGTVGVLATESTVHSMAYQQALRRAAPLLTVLVQACPMLVPLAEEGLLAHPAARLFVEEYVRPMLLQRVSALVLGCTHYPLFVPLLREICGASVAIVDSANSVALAVANILDKAGLRSQANQPAGDALVLCATDVTQRLRRVAADFLGGPVPDVHLVDL